MTHAHKRTMKDSDQFILQIIVDKWFQNMVKHGFLWKLHSRAKFTVFTFFLINCFYLFASELSPNLLKNCGSLYTYTHTYIYLYAEIKHKRSIELGINFSEFHPKVNHQKYFQLGFLVAQFLSSRKCFVISI